MNLKKTFILELWVSIQLIILAVTTYYIFKSNHENVEILFVGIESFLAFPAGLITLYVSDIFIAHNYFLTHETFFLYILLNWIFFAIVGYLQWFIVFPKMIRVCKNNKCLTARGV